MSSSPIFVDYARRVLDRREQDGVRGIYHERNRFSVHIEGAAFARKRLDEVTSVDLRDFIRELQAKPAMRRAASPTTLSTATVKRAFALVCAVFVDAEERDLLKAGPHRGVKVKKRADERSTKEKWTYLSLEEQKLLAKCPSIPEADRLTIRFAIGTGLRQGEQFSLRLADLVTGPDDPHVLVRFGSPNLPPKSGKIRTVPLFGDALVAAKRWTEGLSRYAPENPHGLVFPYPDGSFRRCGKPFQGAGTWRRYLASAGIERRVRWHDLRHTFCSNLVTGALGQVWPLSHVRDMAGHSSVTITERYAHVGQKDLRALGAASSFAHDGPELASTEWSGFDDSAWEAAS